MKPVLPGEEDTGQPFFPSERTQGRNGPCPPGCEPGSERQPVTRRNKPQNKTEVHRRQTRGKDRSLRRSSPRSLLLNLLLLTGTLRSHGGAELPRQDRSVCPPAGGRRPREQRTSAALGAATATCPPGLGLPLGTPGPTCCPELPGAARRLDGGLLSLWGCPCTLKPAQLHTHPPACHFQCSSEPLPPLGPGSASPWVSQPVHPRPHVLGRGSWWPPQPVLSHHAHPVLATAHGFPVREGREAVPGRGLQAELALDAAGRTGTEDVSRPAAPSPPHGGLAGHGHGHLAFPRETAVLGQGCPTPAGPLHPPHRQAAAAPGAGPSPPPPGTLSPRHSSACPAGCQQRRPRCSGRRTSRAGRSPCPLHRGP